MNDLMTKSFMSYVDLKKAAMKDLEAGGDGIELLEAAGGVTDERLHGFFLEAEAVKAEMAAIRDALDRLHAANEEGKSLHQPDALRAHRSRVNADIVAVPSTSEPGSSPWTAPTPRSGGSPRGAARARRSTRAHRRHGWAPEEAQGPHARLPGAAAADDVRVHGDRGAPLLHAHERIISDGRGEELLGAVVAEHEIQDRHDAAREVERSLLELHQVFLDMTVMVETQGEKLDDIERHVANASHYVQGGNKELGKAKEYQRGNRRCLCIGIIILLLLVLLVIVPIATSLRKS